MTTVDIVIPTFTVNDWIKQLVVEAVASVDGQGRIIIVEDGGKYYPIFSEIADVYIRFKKNGGYTKNVNQGLKFSDADFTVIMSSDTVLKEGKIKDLCIKGKVTSPEILNQGIDGMAGCFFVVSKAAKKRGLLVETMKTYYSDEEYAKRINDIFEKIGKVKIYHHQSQTTKAAGVEGDYTEDKKQYKIHENISKR